MSAGVTLLIPRRDAADAVFRGETDPLPVAVLAAATLAVANRSAIEPLATNARKSFV
jgi:hypothetical protein